MLRGNFQNTGGQQINWDDLFLIQDQLYKAYETQFLGNGAFIMQGCTVTGTLGNYAISNGLVYIDGMILPFNSITGVTAFPKYLKQSTPLDQDSFPLEQGGSAYKRTQYKSELAASAPMSGEYITMTASGGRNYNDVLAGQFLRLSGNQTVNGGKTFNSTITGTITNIVDGAVTNSKLATSAVTTTKILNSAVTGAKIMDGSVNAEKTTDDIAKHNHYSMTTIDCDDILIGGIYHVRNSNNANCPSTGTFLLIAVQDGLSHGYAYQIAFDLANTGKGNIYVRDYVFLSGWTSWDLVNDASA